MDSFHAILAAKGSAPPSPAPQLLSHYSAISGCNGAAAGAATPAPLAGSGVTSTSTSTMLLLPARRSASRSASPAPPQMLVAASPTAGSTSSSQAVRQAQTRLGRGSFATASADEIYKAFGGKRASKSDKKAARDSVTSDHSGPSGVVAAAVPPSSSAAQVLYHQEPQLQQQQQQYAAASLPEPSPGRFVDSRRASAPFPASAASSGAESWGTGGSASGKAGAHARHSTIGLGYPSSVLPSRVPVNPAAAAASAAYVRDDGDEEEDEATESESDLGSRVVALADQAAEAVAAATPLGGVARGGITSASDSEAWGKTGAGNAPLPAAVPHTGDPVERQALSRRPSATPGHSRSASFGLGPISEDAGAAAAAAASPSVMPSPKGLSVVLPGSGASGDVTAASPFAPQSQQQQGFGAVGQLSGLTASEALRLGSPRAFALASASAAVTPRAGDPSGAGAGAVLGAAQPPLPRLGSSRGPSPYEQMFASRAAPQPQQQPTAAPMYPHQQTASPPSIQQPYVPLRTVSAPSASTDQAMYPSSDFEAALIPSNLAAPGPDPATVGAAGARPPSAGALRAGYVAPEDVRREAEARAVAVRREAMLAGTGLARADPASILFRAGREDTASEVTAGEWSGSAVS